MHHRRVTINKVPTKFYTEAKNSVFHARRSTQKNATPVIKRKELDGPHPPPSLISFDGAKLFTFKL